MTIRLKNFDEKERASGTEKADARYEGFRKLLLMSRHRLPPLRTAPPPIALSSRSAIRARDALRKAETELEKWQAAFDCHCGNDSDRLRLEIRLAEQRVAAAHLELRKFDPSSGR